MHKYSAIRVGIAGVTGYSGVELMRRLARHPHVEVRLAMASAGSETRRIPALARIWDAPVEALDVDRLAAETDAVFLALPDSVSATLAPQLTARGVRVFDISGAFRLSDVDLRSKWYPHSPADGGASYGLPEHHADELREAQLIACAGCYPTAAILSLRPLVRAGLLQAGIVIDAKSGVSGAGKTPTERTHFSEVHGSLAAYGVFGHRHGAEIEQGIAGATGDPHAMTFVPHLVPLDRGILSTIYVRLAPGTTEDTLAAVYQQTYAAAPF